VSDPQPLAGRVAVITGASRGLGRAMAVALAGAGADIVAAGRAKPDLEETVRLVEGLGRRALAAPTDVASYGEVEALVQRSLDEMGGLDILVNNSGIVRVAPLEEWSPAEWRTLFDVNVLGVLNGCRAAAPHLTARRCGKVINIASVLAAVGLPGYAVYSATKGAIIALTRALAVEWARHNIQVNAIAPGWFDTEMSAAAWRDPKLTERLVRDIPARRIGRPSEVGPLAVYLASAASDFMSGQTIFLDGGHSAA
jgi:2-deoxy-D-gluconate 3-dehydrogenase